MNGCCQSEDNAILRKRCGKPGRFGRGPRASDVTNGMRDRITNSRNTIHMTGCFRAGARASGVRKTFVVSTTPGLTAGWFADEGDEDAEEPVSIHTQPDGRVLRQINFTFNNALFVSIHTQPDGRVLPGEA